MTHAEMIAAIRGCWAETNVAAAFRRAAGIDPLPLDERNPRKGHPRRHRPSRQRREPSRRELERMMNQRYGALDRAGM